MWDHGLYGIRWVSINQHKQLMKFRQFKGIIQTHGQLGTLKNSQSEPAHMFIIELPWKKLTRLIHCEHMHWDNCRSMILIITQAKRLSSQDFLCRPNWLQWMTIASFTYICICVCECVYVYECFVCENVCMLVGERSCVAEWMYVVCIRFYGLMIYWSCRFTCMGHMHDTNTHGNIYLYRQTEYWMYIARHVGVGMHRLWIACMSNQNIPLHRI